MPQPQLYRVIARDASPSQGDFASEVLSYGAATPIIFDFPLQSGYSTALLQGQILPQQSSANGIDPSTENPQQIAGVGFALSPYSETPVAVLPDIVGGASNGAATMLKPGQVFYPGGTFRSFRFGLPYGWLGGGLANMLVLREHVGYAFWTGEPEVLFHAVTVPVYQTTGAPAAAAVVPNWPTRFPWRQALSTFSGGNVQFPLPPALVVVPTKYVLRLRVAAIPAGATIRLTLGQTRDFDTPIIAAGVNPQLPTYGTEIALTTQGASYDLLWNAWAQSGLTIGGVAQVEYPMQTLAAELLRGGGDKAILTAVDLHNNLGSTQYLDIARYGRIGG